MCCFFFLASCIYPPWFGRPVEIEACWYLQTFSLSWDRAFLWYNWVKCIRLFSDNINIINSPTSADSNYIKIMFKDLCLKVNLSVFPSNESFGGFFSWPFVWEKKRPAEPCRLTMVGGLHPFTWSRVGHRKSYLQLTYLVFQWNMVVQKWLKLECHIISMSLGGEGNFEKGNGKGKDYQWLSMTVPNALSFIFWCYRS